MLLIGLLGYAGSGKDTVCKFIQELRPEAQRYAFADELKREVSDGYQIELSRLESNKEDYRHLLQVWGVARREINPSYWVDKVAEKIAAEQPSIAVITDVRFPNEADYIRQQGGLLVRVERPGFGPVNGHLSETAADDIAVDQVVSNAHGLAVLKCWTGAFIDTISIPRLGL